MPSLENVLGMNTIILLDRQFYSKNKMEVPSSEYLYTFIVCTFIYRISRQDADFLKFKICLVEF